MLICHTAYTQHDQEQKKLMIGLFFISCCLFSSWKFGFLSKSYPSNSMSQNPKSELILSNFKCLSGTSFMMAPLQSEPQKQSGFTKIGYQSNTHNYIFLNKETVTFTKLLPTNDYLIKQTTQLTETGVIENVPYGVKPELRCDEKPQTIRWLLYLVITQDTNSDEQLSPKNIPILAMSDVSGKNYTELIPGIQSILGITMKKSQELIVIYRKENQNQVSLIDLLKREVTLTQDISI